MGVELLEVDDEHRRGVVFYCNTEGVVFGPLMDRNVGKRFADSLEVDPRRLSNRGELAERYHSFEEEWMEATP